MEHNPAEEPIRQIIREGMARLWDAEEAPNTARLIRAGRWDDVEPVRSAIIGGLHVWTSLGCPSPATLTEDER